jgi:hypothetical protein
MPADELSSSVEPAAAERRRLGIARASLPGEYRLNFRNGAESTARIFGTFDHPVEAGRVLAKRHRVPPRRLAGGSTDRDRPKPTIAGCKNKK